jgi:ribosome maturation factor RimP
MQPQERESFLESLVNPLVQAQGLELVELRYTRSGSVGTLRILVDQAGGGVALDVCARLNRAIGDALESQQALTESYTLEVSSPGLDRPLTTAKDFSRYVNHTVTVYCNQPIDGVYDFTGVISAVEADVVAFERNGAQIRVPLSAINKAQKVLY